MLTTQSPGEYIVYADGSINPRRSGAGITICTADGTILRAVNRTLPRMTNNEAEYAALHLALTEVQRLNPRVVEIRMDSEIVVNQMAGRFAVNSPKLKPMHRLACELARQIKGIRYVHIRREQNAIADALATEASAGRHWHTRER